MDRNLRIRMLLEASDKVTKPLRDIVGGSAKAAAALKITRQGLKDLSAQARAIGDFKLGQAKGGEMFGQIDDARRHIRGLRDEIARTETPTKRMTNALAAAEAKERKLVSASEEHSAQLVKMRSALTSAGVDVQNLGAHEQRLRDNIAATTATMGRQRAEFDRLDERQTRFAKARAGFARTQNMATGIAAGGAAGIATGRTMARPILGAVEDAQAYQSVMTDIAQKADLGRDRADRMGRNLLAAARAANQMPDELQKGVDTLAGFGLDPTKAVAMMKPIGRAATAYKAEIADLSAAAFAANDNLKVPIEQTGRVIDIMAQAGKSGAFEIKDMASAFPALTAGYQALGQTGTGAVADLAAALQIARKGAGDSSTAASNVANIIQKIASPATIKAFSKFGIDLPNALKKAYAEGKTPLEAIAELTKKATGGDLGKIGFLFEDAQVQQGLRPLIQNMEEYRRIRATAAGAKGTTDTDFAERMKDSAEQTKQLQINAKVLSVSLGSMLLPAVNAITQRASVLASGLARWTERHPVLAKAIAITAAALAVMFIILGGFAIVIAAIMGPIALLNGGLIAMGVAGGTASMGLLPILGTVLAIVAVIALLAGAAYLLYANWDPIKAWFASLWQGMIGVVTGVLGWFGALPARFGEFGRNMIMGMINGITGMLGALKATIVGAASSAANWFKQKLGIRSPSRVFAGFGGFMMQGLSNGIAGGAREPVRRIDRLSRNLTGAMSAASLRPPGMMNDEDAPVRRVDRLSRRLTAALAIGSAVPALTPGTAATPAGSAAYGAAVNAPAPITINVYGAPGQSEQALAAAVERALERAQSRQRAMSRSSFSDTPDGADQ